MTCAWIDTSSALDRLVADDQVRLHGERPGDPDALSLATAELVRIALDEGRIEADEAEQLFDAPPAGRPGSQVMRRQRLGEDGADGLAGIEAGVRVLEDHLERAALAAQVCSVEGEEIRPVEADRAGRRVVDPHDGATRGRLAAGTGLADEAERLATHDVEVDAVDRVDPSSVRRRRTPPVIGNQTLRPRTSRERLAGSGSGRGRGGRGGPGGGRRDRRTAAGRIRASA